MSLKVFRRSVRLSKRVAVLSAALVLLFILGNVSPLALSQQANGPSSCSLTGKTVPPVSNLTATTIAETSPQFLSAVKGKSFYFSGAAASWKCTALESIDANFMATNATGYKEDIVVSMSVSAVNTPVTVISVGFAPAVKYGVCSNNTSDCSGPSQFWSGYQFCDGHNSGGGYCAFPPAYSIQAVYGEFTQPNIYVPSGSNQPGCSNTLCSISSWVGLENCSSCSDPYNYILQTGTAGNISSCFLCSGTTYLSWWEAYPSDPVYCKSWTPTPGDAIYPEVYFYSGNEYYVQTTDASNGQTCSSVPSPYSWGITPLWGDFIVENPAGTVLPKFDNFWFLGQITYEGSTFPISRPFGDGWYAQTYMENIGVINVCSGSWQSGSCLPSVSLSGSDGEFYNTWISSQNT